MLNRANDGVFYIDSNPVASSLQKVQKMKEMKGVVPRNADLAASANMTIF